jgi:Family of unknown function (DUF6152)
MKRRTLLAAPISFTLPAWAHHGWSSFDLSKPIYLEGRASKVAWRNPHVELELEVNADLKLPADLPLRALPAQAAAVDGPALLKAAQLPKRKDKRWTIELAPLTRMEAWKVAEIKPGEPLAVLGFTFADEKGDAVLRVEYLFVHGKTYGLRSAPA